MFPTQTSVLANRRCSFRKRKYCGLSSSKMMVMKMRLKHLARLSSMTFKIAAISKIRSELSLKKLIHLITSLLKNANMGQEFGRIYLFILVLALK